MPILNYEAERDAKLHLRSDRSGKIATMKLPPETKPALLGAAAGAIALAFFGFNWGGWVSGGTMEKLVKDASSRAVITALAPICADNFQRAADSSSQLAELKKISSWQHAAFIEKAGWAKMPGTETISSGMATACAEMILAGKK